MQLVRSVALGIALVACGAPRAKPTPPAPEDPPPADDPNRGCSCARLNAPVEVPAKADELARWERTAAQLATLERAIADQFPANVTCTAAVNDQLAQLFTAHAEAIRESAALNDASCDHFARWRFARWPDRNANDTTVQAMRGGCMALDPASLDQLHELNVTRGCTTTSMR